MNETASEGIDQLQAHIVELEQQLFAEKAARLKAEAAGAEMRIQLEIVYDCCCDIRDWEFIDGDKVRHALGSDHGKGWLSPEVKAKLRQSLEWIFYNGHHHGASAAAEAGKALALLDGKESV